ncbi:DNA topoisomerase [Vibrio coralliilyticus]|uniref:DNA topoisomerase n=1 Tax=Vibrio coralliilyticus TaxID=190893 RepID=UPI001E65919B|nr:DNA topoisomerase [Vibrio coralliilyticus]MCC2524973.1 hypothetical protein [Vibrio coralliilyticus]
MLIVTEKYRTANIVARSLGFGYFCEDHFANEHGDKICFAHGHLYETSHEQPEIYDWKTPDNFNNLPRTLYSIPKKLSVEIRGVKLTSERLRTTIISNMQDSDMIINACDFDREGERIFYDLFNAADTSARIYRMDMSNGLTRRLVCEAYANLLDGTETKSRFYASSARDAADYSYALLTQVATYHARSGDLHPAFTGYKDAKSSTLSIQVPLALLIALKCKEVEQFDVRAIFIPQLSAKIGRYKCLFNYDPELSETDGSLLSHPRLSKQYINAREQQSKEVTVVSVLVKPVTFSPPAPHNTASIQAEMKNLTPSETMSAMQSLYMKGLISYPRSDNDSLSEKNYSNGRLASLLESLSRNEGFSKKDGDDANLCALARSLEHSTSPQCVKEHSNLAHSAIVPTDASVSPGQLNDNEQQVYNSICNRFTDAMRGETHGQEVTLSVCFKEECLGLLGENRSVFTCQKVIGEGDNKLTNLLPGDVFSIDELSTIKHQRDVPQYHCFSELPLIMQQAGLGTAATRDRAVAKLLERKIIDVFFDAGIRYAIITDKGIALLKILPPEFKTPHLTARWEKKLAEIEQTLDHDECNAMRSEFIADVFGRVQYLCRMFNMGQLDLRTSTSPASQQHLTQVEERAKALNVDITLADFKTVQSCHNFLIANPLPYSKETQKEFAQSGLDVDSATLRDSRRVNLRVNQSSKDAPPSEKQLTKAYTMAQLVRIKVPANIRKSAKACSDFIDSCQAKRKPRVAQVKALKQLAQKLEYPIPSNIFKSRTKVVDLTKELRKRMKGTK